MKQQKNAAFELNVNDLVTEEEYNSVQDDRSIYEETLESSYEKQ